MAQQVALHHVCPAKPPLCPCGPRERQRSWACHRPPEAPSCFVLMQAAAESKAAAAAAAAPTDGKKASKKAELEAKKVSSRRRLPIHCMGTPPAPCA